MWVYGDMVLASLLRVDVPLSSQNIGFGSESAGEKMDDKVELRQIFRPLDLSFGEKFGGCKIFKVFVAGDNVNWRSWTFKVVSPDFEGFEDPE